MVVNSVVAHASGRIVGTDQVGLCHFQFPHCIGRLAVRLFSVPLPISTNAMDRAREAGRPAGPLLVVRLGRNAGCHLVLDITFPPFRMIAPLAKLLMHGSHRRYPPTLVGRQCRQPRCSDQNGAVQVRTIDSVVPRVAPIPMAGFNVENCFMPNHSSPSQVPHKLT